MGVAGAGEVFCRGAKLHRDADLVDQITGGGADDMRAQDTVCRLVGEDFYKSIAREIRLGTAVAHKAELADLIVTARVFQLFFGRADIGNLGVGVNHARDHIVVHMRFLPGKTLGAGHAFVLGLMGQHRAVNRIADGIDAVDVGLVVAVRLDLSAL